MQTTLDRQSHSARADQKKEAITCADAGERAGLSLWSRKPMARVGRLSSIAGN